MSATFDASEDGTAQNSASQAQSHPFQADVSRLLMLMAHSIYSNRDVFIRELISNAADACEKLRYEALTKPELVADGAAFAIEVALDKDKQQLTVADNGIGMSHDDLVSALGTIASSGTRAFLDRITATAADGAAPPDLIGQFGIGFYSAFMVADKVTVETQRAGSGEAWRWTSDGKGSYAIEPLRLADAPARGTRVILHLNETSQEYAEPYKAETIIKEHSGAVAIPVDLVTAPGAEAKRIIDGAAIWAKPKSSIEEAEYTEFYRGLAGQFDEPALTIHWRAEGRQEYTVLAFVPGSRPFDLFDPARKGRGKLYVRRVLISAEADLVPPWLRFVRLIVDSADLPLNVSREMIQESPVLAAIKKGIASRILQELGKFAESEPEKFAKIWENFGSVLKEGLYEEADRRDALFKIARFVTSAHPQGGRTLEAYVKDLRPNQTAIFYLTGDDAARLASSPQLEGFKARGIEILLLADPVDAFWVSTAVGFDGKPFKSITQGDIDIKQIPLTDEASAPASSETSSEVATLLAFIKQTLADKVEDVKSSDRLAQSPACLIAPAFGPDRQLERMLAAHGQLKSMSKPILEVNPTHELVTTLAARLKGGGSRELIEDAAWLLYDEARLMDGEAPADAAAFAARLTRILTKAVG